MTRASEHGTAGRESRMTVVVSAGSNAVELDRTVDSVLAQDSPDLQVVIVTDQPVRVDKAGVQVIEGHGSRAAQLNAGLAVADAWGVVFLNAGERLLPGALETGRRELLARPEWAFVSGRCVVLRPYHSDAEFPQQPFLTTAPYEVLLGRNCILTLAAVIFRRLVLSAAGGFDERLGLLYDYELYLRLAASSPVGFHRALVAESPCLDPFSIDRSAATRELADVLRRQDGEVASSEQRRLALHVGRRAWAARHALDELDVAPAPPSGALSFGDFRRVDPLDTNFGYGRGTPIDRHYIEAFLARHAADIKGSVLEVQESAYTTRFGGANVAHGDVLSLLPDNPGATVVGDLSSATQMPEATYDCLIITQVLHLIRDIRAAVENMHRMLRPGGVALVTVPGISQVEWAESWYWGLTVLSAKALFEEIFGPENVEVETHGNVLAATSFLWGVAVEELTLTELDHPDPYYQVIIAVRAVKPRDSKPRVGQASKTDSTASSPDSRARTEGTVILMYHRVADVRVDPWRLAVSPGNFREHLTVLDRHFEVIPLSRVLDASDGRPRVAITFDDGYVDNLLAARVVAERGLFATFFVVTGLIERPIGYWWDELDRILLGSPRIPSRLDLRLEHVNLGVSFDDGSVELGDADRAWKADQEPQTARQRAYRDAYGALRELDHGGREDVLDALARWAGTRRSLDEERRPLSRDELVELAALPGVEIGAHTVSHPVLSRLSAVEQWEEIAGSKRMLENVLGSPVLSFAYPHGASSDYTRETAGIAAAAGFDRACAAVGGRVCQPASRFELPRFMVEDWNAEELTMRVEALLEE